MNSYSPASLPSPATPADLEWGGVPPGPQTLSYPLSPGGYVDSWLVAGPQAIRVTDLSGYDEVQPRPGIMRDFHQPEMVVGQEPMEGGRLEISDAHGPASFPWQIKHGGADHFLDFTTFGFTCHYVRSWAYATIHCAAPIPQARLILTVNGPADLWVNGRHAHASADFHFQVPGRYESRVDLRAGENSILVAFVVIAIRECPYALALQLADGPSDLETTEVRLRTTFPVEHRSATEAALRGAALERALFSGDEVISLHWRDHGPVAGVPLRIRMETQGTEGLGAPPFKPEVHWTGSVIAKRGAGVSVGASSSFAPGRYALVLEPLEGTFPGSRRIPIRIARGEFSIRPYGSLGSRRIEALEVAAARPDHLYGEIARMALGRWEELRRENWADPLARLETRVDCSDFLLVGMLGALQRFGGDPRFTAELRESITAAALNYRYWMDEPGSDAMCFHTENHQILFHTCEVLAGQLFPDKVFPNSGQTGAWHAEKGTRLAMAWLARKAREGFQEWDSNVYFEIDVTAVSHLVDLARDPAVSAMAAMILDKLFLQMALNSFQGVFGSTHGRAYTDLIKGGRLELTSGMCRILWGTGVFNDNIMGTVSLACTRSYDLPDVIRAIACGDAGRVWSRERHGGKYDPRTDLQEGSWEVNKATFKTADYMLCSAQDYFPGKPGNQQHIWQATLGPDAVVFSTHPVCLAEDGAHRPNFWHGNGILPRVAQWKDLVIALYTLPADDWMGFTHAYFPTIHFNEWIIRSGWAFARKGEGYLALYASGGLDLATAPNGAREELRSPGCENVWLCQMGCASRDGAFGDFQDSVLTAPLAVSGLHLKLRTIEGDELAFSWKGDLLVNGQAERITGFSQYENQFVLSELNVPQVRIQAGEDWLVWDFEKGSRSMSPHDPDPGAVLNQPLGHREKC